MDPTTDEPGGSSALGRIKSPSLEAAASWLLGFGLVVFLSVNGGGHGIVFFGQVGIFAWLILVLGTLLALFPVAPLNRESWAAILLLAALTGWACLGLIWTETPDKTLVEIARFSTYGAIFALAIVTRGPERLVHQIGSVGAGVAVVGGLALLSRFFPELFPSATETGRVLTSEAARLSYPLNYWNGLGALLAIGLPSLFQVAAGAKALWARLVATGTIPIVVLAIYFTFSRGGLLASAVAVLAYIALTIDRPRKLLSTAIGLGGGLILVLLAQSRPEIREGLTNAAAQDQGVQMAWLTVLICILTAITAWIAFKWIEGRSLRTRLQLSHGAKRAIFGAGIVVLLVGLIATGAPGKVSDNWENFKSAESPEQGSSRISAANGNGRYQLWASALRQFETQPLRGQGAGSFEYWWAENGDRAGFLRDAHSLYLQLLGELGLVGTALLIALILLILYTGIFGAARARDRQVEWTAPAVAGCLAFLVSAGLDWTWQIPAVVAVFLLLAATILSQSVEMRRSRRLLLMTPQTKARVVLGLLGVAGVAVMFIPVSSNLLLERSRDSVRQSNLQSALDSAKQARAISSSTAAPLIQEAGILESMNRPQEAIQTARLATEAEPINWRNWLTLAAIEARAGMTEQALADFREAKRLNPRSAILSP